MTWGVFSKLNDSNQLSEGASERFQQKLRPSVAHLVGHVCPQAQHSRTPRHPSPWQMFPATKAKRKGSVWCGRWSCVLRCLHPVSKRQMFGSKRRPCCPHSVSFSPQYLLSLWRQNSKPAFKTFFFFVSGQPYQEETADGTRTAPEE